MVDPTPLNLNNLLQTSGSRTFPTFCAYLNLVMLDVADTVFSVLNITDVILKIVFSRLDEVSMNQYTVS